MGFKVGDLVEIVVIPAYDLAHVTLVQGDVGQILCVNKREVGLEFDRSVGYLHGCGGLGRPGYCYFVDITCVRLAKAYVVRELLKEINEDITKSSQATRNKMPKIRPGRKG